MKIFAVIVALILGAYLLVRFLHNWRKRKSARALIAKQRETVTIPSREEVSAAMENLIRTDAFSEPAQTIIDFAFILRAGKRYIFSFSKRPGRKNSMVGHTSEWGDVRIEGPERETVLKTSFGSYEERAGQFKIWKEVEGLLIFCYFWKSDIATQGPNEIGLGEEFGLFYNPATLAPTKFGVWVFERQPYDILGRLTFIHIKSRFEVLKKSD